MRFSQAGIGLLESFEGKKNFVYKDSAGLKSIGIGHLIKEGEKFTSLTDGQIYDLLKRDVVEAEKAVNTLVKIPLNQNQFDALVSLVFNIGYGNFSNSTVLRLLNDHSDYEGAANAFAMWHKERINGVLTPSKGLAKRRSKERELFLTPRET